ncbi:MAG TPA: xanthine dehydrogenase family protein molybdopterin-binding subunit [Stellaceae bacterium]|nr:xanthine dehydrogenase family protein molybdopterin-binding subunit [Stellaceae bacterium]
MGARWFGASVKRTEDSALLTGGATFVDDIHFPGMLHAAVVRSPHAHARVRGVDAAAARALPGIHAVLAFADLPPSMRERTITLLVPSPAITQPLMPYVLAKDEVSFVGEPVALVAAESRHVAEDAAQRVVVDYETLPAVADPLAALVPGSPLAHAASPGNLAAQAVIAVGDADAAFARAPHVFKERIHQHRGGPFPLECRGMIATWDRTAQQLTVYASSQSSHRQKRVLLDLLDLGDHQVRVITPEVGGGFGPKGAFYGEYGALVAATMRLGRPVKWIEDRRENFLATHQERDQIWDVEIALDGDARILGVRGRLVHEAGAYMPWGVVLPWIAASTVPGPYVVPNYRMEFNAVFTNKVSTTPVRGAGRPEAVVVMERLMDRAARELGLDPAELRRRNFIVPQQMPYNVGIIFRDGRPVTYDSGDYPACMAKALAAADYAGFAARQAAARAQGRYLGIGIANAVEGTGLGPFESATLRIASNGRVTLYTGATPQGQSHKTTLAQVAADQLGIVPSSIDVVTADTAAVSLGVGSFAARTAVNAGNSVHLAAIAVADKLKRLAAEMLEAAEDDLELADGFVRVKGVPDLRKSFREIAVRSLGMPGFSMTGTPGVEATSYFTPDQSTYSNGSHVAEVEVDVETGQVTVLRYTVMHDCGAVINPMVVAGQVVGGIAHGIGNAFFERMLYDGEAQPVTTNFGEYLLPTATDMPPVALHHMETPTPLNPLGIKGAGETGTISSIAALLGAVENALAPFGVRIAEAPITPPRIVALLRERQTRA